MKRIKNPYTHICILFILIITAIVTTISLPLTTHAALVENDDMDLQEEFKPIIESIFSTRNASILNSDKEELKKLYNLKTKVSLWAYESEVKKVEYLTNWSEKQSVKFSDISSTIKIRKVAKKDKNTFGVTLNASTKYGYYYTDTPDIINNFWLGTNHYINLRKDEDKYVITKEWYTDPFADSLDLTNIKSKDVKEYILNQRYPDYEMDDRTSKAMEYAHRYCGVSTDPEYLFKYNKDYTNFNPQGGDCANFASQILHEGAGFKKNNIWNYCGNDGSKAWVNAQGFKNYITNSGRGGYIAKGTYQQVYKRSFNLRPGDFVAYEKKGRVVHISTVTGLDSKGYPLVTCHNTDRLLVPYDLGWSNPSIKYHLIDVYY